MRKFFAVALGLLFIAATSKDAFSQCITNDNMVVTPMPVNGEYTAGQTVQFCYTVNSYANLSTNWHLGIGVQLGAGWDASSLTAVGQPTSLDGNGTWLWMNNVTSSQTGQSSPYWGWYYDSSSGSPGFSQDGNPGNNYGDCCGGPWTYCWSVTTSACPPGSNGADLGITVHNYADGELGSWTNFDCGGDANYTFSATLSCIQCGTPTASVVQHESCPGDANGEVTVSMNGGNPPFSYSWNTTPVQNTQTATGLSAGTYTVTVTDADQCVVTASATVTVGNGSDATINNINANNELCANDAAVQVTTVQSGGTFSGTGINATGLFDPSTASLGANTITYTIGGNCPDTQTMDITVLPNADATINDINQTNQLCSGNSPVQLTAATAGGTWSGTGVNATGMFDPASAGVGVHTITYSIADPCGDTQTLDITVGDLTVTTSSTASICTADNGSATVTPQSGNAPYTYSWNTTPVQATQTASNLAPGNYDVTVDDADGCSLTSNVIVTADPSNLTVSIPNSTDASCNGVCDGEALAVEAGGTAPYLFIWDDPNNQTTAQATGLCAGTFNVGIADANGCLATAQVVISEPTTISVSAVMDQQSDCGQPNGEATATASGGSVAVDYQYSWDSTPLQTTATATGLPPATYTITATDDNGCEATATVDITSTPGITVSITSFTDATCFQGCDGEATATAGGNPVLPITYNWNSTPAQTTVTATGLCAGSYDLTATDNVGCTATANVTIGEPTELVAQATASTTQICIGQSTDLTAIANGGTPAYASYSWIATPADATLPVGAQSPTVSPIVTTDYTLEVTDANGCTSNAVTVTVEVLPPLTLDITRPLFSPDTGICPYDFATLDLQGVGGDGNYTYYLLPDNSTPVQFPIQVQPSSTTTYDFMVSDGCGTPEAFASSIVTIYSLPVVDFVGDDLAGCQPHSVAFTDLTDPPPVAWNWNFGDPSSNSNTSTAENPTHTFDDAGTYTVSVSVTTAEGCVQDTTFSEYVEVFPLPVANFNASPEQTTVLQANISFTDLSSGNIATWDWQFGDGESDQVQNPLHTYLDTGTFQITLHVVTTDGCEDIDRGQIIIDPDFMFYVPNAFTPNGDEKNDYFRGYGEGVKWDTYEMFIYNRWGEEIYYTNSIDAPWNGWYKNREVEVGTYVYMIRIYDLKGNQHTFRDGVSVIR